MSAEFSSEVVTKIITFLREIGIRVTAGAVPDETFLPGIEVDKGGLIVDETKLKYPGDLLHEAGHLAVTSSADREKMSGEVKTLEGEPPVIEVEAILWSYAACLYLHIDPRVVFHEHGYHGRSESLLQNFEFGVFLGVSHLEAVGMTLSPADAALHECEPFPAMQKWMRH